MTAVVDRDGRVVGDCEARESCAVCDAAELRPALRIERVPVHMGCTAQRAEHDAFADQVWVVCGRCGCLQLAALPPLALVYQAQHNAAIGAVWSRHHRALADFVATRAPRSVVEIGGATGVLARQYVGAHEIGSWTVVEPNPAFTPEPPVRVIEAFVEDAPEAVAEADAIVHSHLLEHLYRPLDLLASVRDAAADGAPMIVSVPDLEALLAHSGGNALNFEHTYFFGIPTLLWMLQDAGFELDELRRFERHSIFVVALAKAGPGDARRPPDASAGAATFARYVEDARADAARLARRAEEFDGRVYLFGGHVFSQFLLVSGFPEARATAILDNDPAKQGLRLYGTGLTVEPPAVVAEYGGPAAVVVRAAHYTAEITAQLRELAPQVEIW